jgi:hypothetical protein
MGSKKMKIEVLQRANDIVSQIHRIDMELMVLHQFLDKKDGVKLAVCDAFGRSEMVLEWTHFLPMSPGTVLEAYVEKLEEEKQRHKSELDSL